MSSQFTWRCLGTLCFLLSLATCNSGRADELAPLDKAVAAKISFRKDVWPIMKRHCWGCHTGADKKGGLSVDTVADMLKGGEGGPLFEVGKPDASLLIEMVAGDAPEMPKKQPSLSRAKIDILRGWILAGATDDSIGGSGSAVRIPQTYNTLPAVNSLSLSADGQRLAAAYRSEIVLIDLNGKTPPRRLATSSDLLSHVEFSPDGTLLAAAGGSPARYGEVRFYDPSDGTLISLRRFGSDTFFRGNFSPDSKTIALGGSDGAIHLVPVDSSQAVRRFELHSDWVLDVAFSSDGKLLVSGSRDKATKICSVETGKLLRSVDTSNELISSVASDGQFAISAGRARTLIGFEYKIALSGVEVSGAGNAAKPISKRNQYVKSFESQPGEIFDIATSADRKTIAVAGAYGDVRVYAMANRKRIAMVSKVSAPVYSLALNSNGSRLALGTKSGVIQVYVLPQGKLIKSLSPLPIKAPSVETSSR